MVDRKLTGAHYGIKDWLFQRVTAIILFVYTVLFIIGLFFIPTTYEEWKTFFSFTIVKIFTQITFLALVIHAWIGVRDIWMDYVKPAGLRLTLDCLTVLWLIACLIYSIFVIWGV